MRTSPGEYRKAIEYRERANLEIGGRWARAYFGNLSNAYKSLGEYRKAIEYHERALKMSEEIGDRAGRERGLGNLGVAYDSLGVCARPSSTRRALKISDEIGDRWARA